MAFAQLRGSLLMSVIGYPLPALTRPANRD